MTSTRNVSSASPSAKRSKPRKTDTRLEKINLNRNSFYWIPAEFALLLVTLSSALLLQRLFETRDYLRPVALTILYVHIWSAVTRRIGLGFLVRLILGSIGAVVTISLIFYRPTLSSAVIPTAETLTLFRSDIELARQIFNDQSAPVPVVRALVVAAALLMGILAAMSDSLAFRWSAPGQSLVNPISVITIVSMLGTNENQVSSVLPVIIAIFTFLLLYRAASKAVLKQWPNPSSARQAYTTMLIFGALLAAIAIYAGSRYGPELPGADAEPLLQFGEQGQRANKPLEVVSPMVEIQPRLLNQTNKTIFFVESEQRSYWRISSLDLFDGVLWRSQGQFKKAKGSLDLPYKPAVFGQTFTQTYDLVSLDSVWAPAAYLPTEITLDGDTGINYEAESATLIVDTSSVQVSNGLQYKITSALPHLSAQQLNEFANRPQRPIDQRYLDLPDNFSETVRSQSAEIVAGAGNRYEQALAIQNFFRLNFVYDVDVARGHDITRIEDFLAARRGYCEQFAGSYAAMARSVGIPARVAIGFTPGDPDPVIGNRYIVRGKHAHAWVEVYIDGAGWVAFEPTPGRGMPGTEDYTGNPEEQDSQEPPPPPTPTPDTSEQEQQAQSPPPQSQEQPAAPTPTPEIPQPEDSEEPTPETDVADSQNSLLNSSVLTALLLILALIGYFVGVPILRRRHDQNLVESRKDDHRLRITRAWVKANRLLSSKAGGVSRSARDETISEYVQRSSKEQPETARLIQSLGKIANEAAYNRATPDLVSAQRCETLLEQIDTQLGYPDRYSQRLSLLDPRPLFGWISPDDIQAQHLAEGAVR